MLFLPSAYLSLPAEPGVYLFLNKKGDILYVGKAKNLKQRVSSYFASPTSLHPKTQQLVTHIAKIRVVLVESELESLLLEANFIKKYVPKYNIRLTDGKVYPLIQITKHHLFPAVLTARKEADKKSVYFGPYPNVKAMRMVLRTIRRIFPFQSVLNHPKKKCLYYHLHLCPCPPTFTTIEETKEYKKTISYIQKFLEGKTKDVIKLLEKERDAYSQKEEFEKAERVQKQIDAIYIVTQRRHQAVEYEVNPNLREDLRKHELDQLQTILTTHNVPVTSLHRIECFDISNTQGTNPTASMVVFVEGEKYAQGYRKFKMKTKGPNDFAMMAEVIERRLNHTEWDYPDLLIVDGGKGQISSAYEVLKTRNISIPLVGLAKREEIIITSDFSQIVLPHKTKALQLVMRIRDEAHRFAITYHRKLRSKNTYL